MADGFATMLQPLRRYADFSGRSRRTELLLFYLLIMIVNLLAYWGDTALFDLSAGAAPVRWFSTAADAALLLPTLALAARRLHDTGRSGWWLLLAFPVAATNLWDSWRRLEDPFAVSVQSSLSTLVMIPLGLALLAFMVLLLWNDEEGTNRYGPNPRYDAEEAAT